jgi:urease accessory protein
VEATVEEGGRLEFLPEPIVAATGCDHHVVSTVELAASATLVWREEIVGGRHDEPPGDLATRITIRRSMATIYRQDLAIGPSARAWDSPAVLGANHTTGTVLLVDEERREEATCDGGALMPLAVSGAWLATAVAPAAHILRQRLAALTR